MNNPRVLPVAIVAVGALLVLKAAGLVSSGHFAFGAPPAPTPANAAAAAAAPDAKGYAPPQKAGAAPPGDLAVLEQLTERRKQLDQRQAELDQREALLSAAEKRLAQRISELQSLEADINQKTQATQAADVAQMKSLAAMYEAMKPADAAHIFDRLDMPVLSSLAKVIKPQKLAAILSLMTAETAQRLTLELAGAGPPRPAAGATDINRLPKIGENGLTPGH